MYPNNVNLYEKEGAPMKHVFFTALILTILSGAAWGDGPETGVVTGTRHRSVWHTRYRESSLPLMASAAARLP